MPVWIPGRFIIQCVTSLSQVPEHLEIEDSSKVPFGPMKGLGSDKIFEVDKNYRGKSTRVQKAYALSLTLLLLEDVRSRRSYLVISDLEFCSL